MTTENNVISIGSGKSVVNRGEANPDIVNYLDELLIRAKAGEIVAIGVALCIDDLTSQPLIEQEMLWNDGFALGYAFEASINALKRNYEDLL